MYTGDIVNMNTGEVIRVGEQFTRAPSSFGLLADDMPLSLTTANVAPTGNTGFKISLGVIVVLALVLIFFVFKK